MKEKNIRILEQVLQGTLLIAMGIAVYKQN